MPSFSASLQKRKWPVIMAIVWCMATRDSRKLIPLFSAANEFEFNRGYQNFCAMNRWQVASSVLAFASLSETRLPTCRCVPKPIIGLPLSNPKLQLEISDILGHGWQKLECCFAITINHDIFRANPAIPQKSRLF